jgi:histidinol-phosphate aminotransferase
MSDRELRERLGPRSDLVDLQTYRAPQLEAQVSLNTNESPYPPPDEFMDDLASRIRLLALHRYPDREAEALRQGLAAHAGTLTDRVWVANGSNEVLMQLLLAFGGAERKAMTFEPTYTMHGLLTRISGTRLLRARRNPDFSLHLEASVEAVRSQEPDILLLCSPNNPTGNVMDEAQIGALCEASGGIVILDEAYAEFASASFLRFVEDYDNLAITRSFSKAWRLAGARLGYLVAQPWVIEELQKVRLPYHLSALSQAAGLTALDHAGELMATVETVRHERDRLYRELSTTTGITAYPSEGNFIFFRCNTREATSVWQGLLDRGVLVRDFSSIPSCEEHLRVSVGTPEEDERFLEALSEVLSGK